MFAMVVINAVGVKFLSRVNSFIVIFKLGVPLLTIIVLFSVDWHANNLFSHGFAPMGLKSILSALPVAGVIFSYIGYSPAIQLAGEAKDPQRSIPIAVLGALGICIVFFLLLQIVFLGALKPEAFANGWANLSFTGDSGPFVGILLGLNIVWMVYILYSGAMIAPFGTALIYTAAASRICYAMGDNGYLFKPLMKLNKYKVPMRIIVLNYVIGLFLFLPFPTWQRMVGFLVISFIFSYAAGPLALLVLRRTLPHIKRPFKLPVPRLFCLLAFYVSNLIVYWTGWSIISKMIIGICLGYIVLAFFKLTSEGKQLKLEWKTSWWVFLYIIFVALMSYLGAFGPVKLIPFGWDFLVIGIGSWVIYELAINFYVKKIDDPVINPT